MALRGWARFAWQADYGQFYLIDAEDAGFEAPIEITAEMDRRSLFVPAAGIVIYTQDCLNQHIRIAIHESEPDHPPVEEISGKPWTRVETVEASFPSGRFTMSSPSMPFPLPGGPLFFLNATTVTARISWMEFEGTRDESVPFDPDVIQIALWTR
ncbi:MAG TPA: hypothetical protein VNS12_09705 [Pelagibacterium sp.]|uniref:hypothetical protein n=1 Tax=Pelagibacterium sp. TaxID=1967288 RepID=UPI002BACE375|nr:hypothetical protein [Pelagibacterium sp.]HWJ88332.1 hypothetical protein [Pelagibacterium sp.]